MKHCLLLLSWMLLLAAGWGGAAAEPEAAGFYVQLIRGTNEDRPPDPTFKPIGAKLSERLSPIFRWKRYWEVRRETVSVSRGKPVRLQLNEWLALELEITPDSRIESRLYREGELARKSRQNLKTFSMEILGGTRGEDHSWFVVVRQDAPE